MTRPPTTIRYRPAPPTFDDELAARGFVARGSVVRVAPGYAVPVPAAGSTHDRIATLEAHRAAHYAARAGLAVAS